MDNYQSFCIVYKIFLIYHLDQHSMTFCQYQRIRFYTPNFFGANVDGIVYEGEIISSLSPSFNAYIAASIALVPFEMLLRA